MVLTVYLCVPSGVPYVDQLFEYAGRVHTQPLRRSGRRSGDPASGGYSAAWRGYMEKVSCGGRGRNCCVVM